MTYTRLEKLMILCVQGLLRENGLQPDDKTLLIVASTKGNIALLRQTSPRPFPKERVFLAAMAHVIADYFGFLREPLVVSNACISGALALSVAADMLQGDSYDHAIVVAGDEISRFIMAGFTSFQALSDAPCRPYDRDRNGLNLGEAVAAVYLSKTSDRTAVEFCGSGFCNDANHISGPSRTGEGQYRSIQRVLARTGMPTVDFISAHGTATRYNDEMEATALGRSGLQEVPLHSLKGYFGHTLGASGLLETILAVHCLRDNWLPRTLGFENLGTSRPIHVSDRSGVQYMQSFMKLASGFGGCNIASIFKLS